MKKWFLHLIGHCVVPECKFCTDKLIKEFRIDKTKKQSNYFASN